MLNKIASCFTTGGIPLLGVSGRSLLLYYSHFVAKGRNALFTGQK
jgi:hypothetical protein